MKNRSNNEPPSNPQDPIGSVVDKSGEGTVYVPSNPTNRASSTDPEGYEGFVRKVQQDEEQSAKGRSTLIDAATIKTNTCGKRKDGQRGGSIDPRTGSRNSDSVVIDVKEGEGDGDAFCPIRPALSCKNVANLTRENVANLTRENVANLTRENVANLRGSADLFIGSEDLDPEVREAKQGDGSCPIRPGLSCENDPNGVDSADLSRNRGSSGSVDREEEKHGDGFSGSRVGSASGAFSIKPANFSTSGGWTILSFVMGALVCYQYFSPASSALFAGFQKNTTYTRALDNVLPSEDAEFLAVVPYFFALFDIFSVTCGNFFSIVGGLLLCPEIWSTFAPKLLTKEGWHQFFGALALLLIVLLNVVVLTCAQTLINGDDSSGSGIDAILDWCSGLLGIPLQLKFFIQYFYPDPASMPSLSSSNTNAPSTGSYFRVLLRWLRAVPLLLSRCLFAIPAADAVLKVVDRPDFAKDWSFAASFVIKSAIGFPFIFSSIISVFEIVRSITCRKKSYPELPKNKAKYCLVFAAFGSLSARLSANEQFGEMSPVWKYSWFAIALLSGEVNYFWTTTLYPVVSQALVHLLKNSRCSSSSESDGLRSKVGGQCDPSDPLLPRHK